MFKAKKNSIFCAKNLKMKEESERRYEDVMKQIKDLTHKSQLLKIRTYSVKICEIFDEAGNFKSTHP